MQVMKNIDSKLNRLASFKVVLIYSIVSAAYIYTSDYFLRAFTSDAELISRLQTYKGLAFIFITAILLYTLVKRNISTAVTKHKQIIEAQREANQQQARMQEEYTALFNSSPLPMCIFDLETLRFLLVNDAACRVYQFSREEFLSMTLGDIRPVEEVPLMEEILSAVIQKASVDLPNIIRHKKKNGEIMLVKIHVVFVNFNGKKVRLATVADLTPEVQMQNKLIESNSRLKMASEIAGLGYWTNDMVKSEIHWTDEIYKIFEVDPATFELSVGNIRMLFHPEDRRKFDPEVYETLENKTINECECRIITGTGKIKWVLERQYLTKDKDGVPVRIEGIMVDITRRKLQEQNIRESNERFKVLTKATVEAIIDWDIQNNEVIWGEGFHTIMGYDLNESDFNLWSDNIHPDDRKLVLRDLSKTISDPAKQNFNAEYRFMKANGDVAFVQHRGVFIRDANGKAIRALGAIIDLTEALARLRKIEVQDKALKDIAWMQSHVVRAPLANLMGLIDLIKSNVDTGVSDSVLLGYISNSAEKLDMAIRDIVMKTSISEQDPASGSSVNQDE